LIILLIELNFCKQTMQCNLAFWDSFVDKNGYQAQ